MASGFMAGAIVGKMILDRTKWAASVKKVKKDEETLKGMSEKTAMRFQKMGRGMTIAGAAITGAMGMMVGAAVKMNEGMANVATLIPDATGRLIELRSTVQDLAMATGKGTSDITDGLYQVISAFGDGADTAKILEINVRAAAAGMATTTDSINLTSAVMKGYGDVSAAATMKTADLAFMTVKLGQTTFPELASSMGQVIPIAAKMNVSQKELFATFATLTGVTGKASEVTTQMRSVMAGMMKPTEDMAKAISGLGYKTAEAMIADLGLVGSMRKLIDTTDGSTTAVGKLFNNVRALPAVFALTGGQAGVFDEKLKAMNDTAGAMEGAFEAMTQGINKTGFDMARLKQMTTVLAQKIGDHLAPVIGNIVASFGKVVSAIGTWMKEHPKLTEIIVKATAAVGALMLGLGPIMMIVPKLVRGFGLVKGGIQGVILGMKLLKGMSLATLGPIGLVVAALGALTIGYLKVRDAQKKMEESTKAAHTQKQILWEKLGKASEAAGMTAREFEKLTGKYNGNIAAMAMAISRGEESVELQESLAAVGKEHAEAIEDQKGALDDLGGAFTNVKVEGEKWLEYLKNVGILTTEQKRAKADELYGVIDKLDKAYKDGVLNLADWTIAVKGANKELESLTSTEAIALPQQAKVNEIMRLSIPLIKERAFATQTAEQRVRDWAKANKIGYDEALRGMYRLTSTMLKFANITMPELGKASKDAWPQIAEGATETTTAWTEAANSIKTSWTRELGEMLVGAKSFKDAAAAVWGEMKRMFADMVAKMVVNFAIDGVKDLIGGAKKAASGIGKAVESVGSATAPLAAGIGTLITTLAQAIATAAEIIAASAPAILIAAGVALAIYAGFKVISGLFKKSAKPGSELDFLRQITENTFTIKDLLLGDYKAELHIIQGIGRNIFGKVESLNPKIDLSNKLLRDISGFAKITAEATKGMAAALKNVTSAAAGAVIKETQLVMVHGTPNNPEYIQKESDLMRFNEMQKLKQQKIQQQQITLNYQQSLEMKGTMISDRDYARQRLLPEMLDALETKQGVDRLKKILGL